MKKILLTLGLVVITSFIYAQNLTFGPKIGGSIFTDQGKMGLNIGGFVGYDCGKIEIETEGVFFATLDEFNLYKCLVLIPLNARIEIVNGLKIIVGPLYGINLSKWSRVENGIYLSGNNNDFLGFGVGFGYDFSKRIRVELMYKRSLSTFGENLSQDAYSTVNFGISWNLFRKKTK